jgi:hypothetical protein
VQQPEIGELEQVLFAGSQTSAVQALLSSQSLSVTQQFSFGVWVHWLSTHASSVQVSPSLQSPFNRQQFSATALIHVPVLVSQESTVQALVSAQSSSASQQPGVGENTQVLVLRSQLSSVQALPSLHCSLFVQQLAMGLKSQVFVSVLQLLAVQTCASLQSES